MEDLNAAAPSSTEPSNEAAKTDMQGAGVAAVGESALSAVTAANATADANVSATSQVSDLNPGGDAGNVSAAPATSVSNAAVSGDAGTGAVDDPNAAASPAAGQSASDTASSAQGASQGGVTAARAWPDNAVFVTHEEVIAANDELQGLYRDARARIADLEQQLTDEQANVVKWQGLYNAASVQHPAKSHLSALLAKLESGEAIVLGDLMTKLRALVGAL